MNIYDSNLWFSDLDEIIEVLPELKELEGKSILVTGSTGLICSALIDVLIRWNTTHDNKIIVHVEGRNENKIKQRFSPYYNEKWFRFVQYDASCCTNRFDFLCEYIIHDYSND